MSLIIPGEVPKPKPTWEAYEDEFRYADEIEERVPEIMEKFEDQRAESYSGQAAEEYWRLYEQNVESGKQYHFDNQEELKLQRTGHIFHMNEFLRLLRNAGLNAWYTDKGGMERTLGLFVTHENHYPTCSHKRGEPHYVGFVQVPLMQEFEELFFDQYNIPLGSKRRGWRTVLLRMIEQRLITEDKVREIFGVPELNVISRRYLHYLQYLRGVPK